MGSRNVFIARRKHPNPSTYLALFLAVFVALGPCIGVDSATSAWAKELNQEPAREQVAPTIEANEQDVKEDASSVEPMASSGAAQIVGNELITPDYKLTLPDYWLKNANLKIDYRVNDGEYNPPFTECSISDSQTQRIFAIAATYTPDFAPYPTGDGILLFSKKVGNCYLYAFWEAWMYYLLPAYDHNTAVRVMELNSGGSERYTTSQWAAMNTDERMAVANRCTDWLRGALSNVSLPFENVPVSSDPNVSYIYRLVNPYTNKHFFTADASEANSLQAQGWHYENIGWNAPKTSSTPIYRLYNPYTTEHLYTADKHEYDILDAQGWDGENIKFYSAGNNGTPAWRLYNRWAPEASAHHYTTDKNEHDTLIAQGWKDEGVCWHGL